MSLKEGQEGLEAGMEEDELDWATVLVSPLFAANEPATPAATTASTTDTANAMLRKNVAGRSPHKRLLFVSGSVEYVSYDG